MKRIVAFVFVAFAMTSVVSAQQDRFSSEQACVNAVEAGTAVWYQPSFFDHRNRPPARPVATTRALEERGCVEMWIVGGWAWIPQPGVSQVGENAPQFDFDTDGQPIRRSDCGNRVRKIVYVPEEKSELSPSPPPSPPSPSALEQEQNVTVNVTIQAPEPSMSTGSCIILGPQTVEGAEPAVYTVEVHPPGTTVPRVGWWYIDGRLAGNGDRFATNGARLSRDRKRSGNIAIEWRGGELACRADVFWEKPSSKKKWVILGVVGGIAGGGAVYVTRNGKKKPRLPAAGSGDPAP